MGYGSRKQFYISCESQLQERPRRVHAKLSEVLFSYVTEFSAQSVKACPKINNRDCLGLPGGLRQRNDRSLDFASARAISRAVIP